MASTMFRVSFFLLMNYKLIYIRNDQVIARFVIRSDAPNVSVHFPTGCFTNSKVANTANMIFKYYLRLVVENVVNLLLAVSSRQCQLLGIPIVSVVQCATNS